MDMCGKSAYCWKTMLTGRRFEKTDVTSFPCRKMRPSSGTSKPAIIRRVVVFPQPLGPSSEKNSPSRIASVTLRTASALPKRLLTSSRAIATLRSPTFGPSLTGGSRAESGEYRWLSPVSRTALAPPECSASSASMGVTSGSGRFGVTPAINATAAMMLSVTLVGVSSRTSCSDARVRSAMARRCPASELVRGARSRRRSLRAT